MKTKRDYRGLMRVASRQTVLNHMKHLEKLGYLVASTFDGEPVFIFAKDSSKWELVDYPLLKFLIATCNMHAIKIYCYLLNKFKWKDSLGEYYTFTAGELARALGYSDGSSHTSTVLESINLVLEGFERWGLITIKRQYDAINRYYHIDLYNVVIHYDDLPSLAEIEKEERYQKYVR